MKCARNEWTNITRIAGLNFSLSRGANDPIQSFGFGSWHASIGKFVLCDGSVKAIQVSIDGDTLERLASRRDGLIIDGSY